MADDAQVANIFPEVFGEPFGDPGRPFFGAAGPSCRVLGDGTLDDRIKSFMVGHIDPLSRRLRVHVATDDALRVGRPPQCAHKHTYMWLLFRRDRNFDRADGNNVLFPCAYNLEK
ncbi:hypothetical protein [Modestobacter sp. URMC 112]